MMLFVLNYLIQHDYCIFLLFKEHWEKNINKNKQTKIYLDPKNNMQWESLKTFF